jgi:hypothetical protein
MASPHAGRRALHASPTAIQAPSRSMQSRILGPRPGATVHRCSTGHLVRSSEVLTRDSASLIEGALQRSEGWRECRMPPLGDPCGLSWSCAALRGPQPGGPGRLWVSVRPVRRFDALRVVILRTSSRPEGRGSAPRALSCSYRDMSLQPRTEASLRRALASRRKTRPAMQPLLGFRALQHVPDRQIRMSGATDPSEAAYRVRGLGTPFAISTTGPPDAEAPERSWA